MHRFAFVPTLLVLTTPALAAEEGGGNVFAGTIAQSIAAAIVFLILVTILYKKAWGPILKGLQDRENKIKGDLESAEKASTEAAQTLDAYRKQLAEAQTEAGRVIEQARRDAEQVAAKLKAETESEIRQIKDRAQRDIAAAKEQAVNEIYAQTARLSTAIAGRILQREINPADQEQLVQASLAELTKVN